MILMEKMEEKLEKMQKVKKILVGKHKLNIKWIKKMQLKKLKKIILNMKKITIYLIIIAKIMLINKQAQLLKVIYMAYQMI